MTPPKNMSASVRQRLLNRARRDRRPFNELVQYYAMERFLYRLSQSEYADCFILKGALLLSVWRTPDLRPTMDIDMLGRTSNEESNIINQVQDILAVDVGDDGLLFQLESIQSERITEAADYEGIRIRFQGTLGSARVWIQMDIGFGDNVYPEPEESIFPTMLDSPAPRLLCYSRESVIAEKFETMVKLGELNSRMKDFYDIWLLSRLFNFQGGNLSEAIRLTFQQRDTLLPEGNNIFPPSFIKAKQPQWTAFRKRLQQPTIPESFEETTDAVHDFLMPIVEALGAGRTLPITWKAPGPWRQQPD